MKILYSIQATGNGHISRAEEVIPQLQKYGKVDALLSGSNSTLNPSFKIKYRLNGLSLFYGKCGGLSYKTMFMKNSVLKAYKDAYQLPVSDYDVIINDFDFVTSMACKMKKVKSIHFGHQASFISDKSPRPEIKSGVGEFILHNYAKAEKNIGLHFVKYDDHIHPPIIKKEILDAKQSDEGHITVYLPSVNESCIVEYLTNLPQYQFHFFSKERKTNSKEKNINFFPVDNNTFTNSLISCHGLITGGGFETPAECIYLGKKLMSIPIRSQYEQQCNAAALKLLGVKVLNDIPLNFSDEIEQWINSDRTYKTVEFNNIEKTIEEVIQLGAR